MTTPELLARAAAAARRRGDADVWIGGAAVGLTGAGAVLAAGGAAATSTGLVIAGGAALCAGLITLLTAGWVDGLVLLTLALPLPALYSTDAARVSPAAGLTALVVSAWVLRRGWDGRAIDIGALPRRPTLLLAGAVAVAAAFAQVMLPALRELATLWLMFALLVVVADGVRAEPRRAESIALMIAVAGAVAGVLAVLQAAGVLPGQFRYAGTSFNRASLGFEWPNELAMFLALALPFSVHARTVAQSGIARVLATAGVGACLLGLTATFSRGSWLAALAATAVLGIAGERRLMLRVWMAGLVAVLAIDLGTGGALRSRIAATLVDQVVLQRLALQLAGLLMFRAHPIVGVGPGGFGESLDRFGAQIPWLWDYVGSAHNMYVHVAAEMGIVGLAALLVFLAAVFIVLLRSARTARSDPATEPEAASLRRTLLWSFATACLVGLVEWPFAHGIGQLIMVVIGMGCALAGRRVAVRGR